MQLVEFSKDEIWAESNLVARKIGIKHHDFMKSAGIIIKKLDDLMVGDSDYKFKIESRHYRGRDFEVCLMNRKFFSLVMMRFETKKAFEWQVIFNDAFYAMEEACIRANKNKEDVGFVEKRQQGVIARREETDAIQAFVTYATQQGSKNANFYYKHITNATYKALGLISQKHPKLRDQMNIYEVSELLLAERLASSKLKEYMFVGRNYKDIYSSVKEDLINFSNAVRLH